MNRNYRIADSAKLCLELRTNSPTVFYGNWMVGFPGESSEDYEATRALVERLNQQINVAIPFSARPNTPAAEMAGQIAEDEKLARRDDLVDLIASLKSSEFATRMGFLEPRRRDAILQAIQLAERFEYRVPTPEN